MGIRLRQKIGFLLGITCGLILIVILILPSQQKLHAKAPMNRGHEELSCESCHQLTPGTMKQ